MILSAQSIAREKPLSPLHEKTLVGGLSYGLSAAGYDIRISQEVDLTPGEFALGSSVEYFTMPLYLMGIVHDKSTWARQGLALQNTVIEPGWRGFLTLELSNHSSEQILIRAGAPIAQVIFHVLDESTHKPYTGKYQNQPNWPCLAILEK